MQWFKTSYILIHTKNNYTLIFGELWLLGFYFSSSQQAQKMFFSTVLLTSALYASHLCIFLMCHLSPPCHRWIKDLAINLTLILNICVRNPCSDFWALEWLVKIQVFWKAMLVLPRLQSVRAVCLPNIKQQLCFLLLLLKINETRRM